MTWRHGLRLALRRAGIDVHRYPAESAEAQSIRMLISDRPDLLLDVGGHRGSFVSQCRALGYSGPAVSFEPVPYLAQALANAAHADPEWCVVPRAVTDHTGTVTIHVAGNDGASSSLLSMLDLHAHVAPESAYVADCQVPSVRLDEWIAANAPKARRIAVKIDVQGAERAVLEGLGATLNDVIGVRIELSTRALYAGAWTWWEACEWLRERHFALVGVVPGFTGAKSGEMLQFDAVFRREQ